jgi:hypothetical protein
MFSRFTTYNMHDYAPNILQFNLELGTEILLLASWLLSSCGQLFELVVVLADFLEGGLDAEIKR